MSAQGPGTMASATTMSTTSTATATTSASSSAGANAYRATPAGYGGVAGAGGADEDLQVTVIIDQKKGKHVGRHRVQDDDDASMFSDGSLGGEQSRGWLGDLDLTPYYHMMLHVMCIAMYLLPIITPSQHNKGNPVLDELHIVSPDNRDVNGEISSLRTIFTNDYWGRPMNAPNSHKSWRPLTVLTFRFFKGLLGGFAGGRNKYLSDLNIHRIFNVITHAGVAELVGIMSLKLLPTHVDPDTLKLVTKIAFMLHPTHVEVTANAANRNHLLAVLCSVVLSDPDLPLPLFGVVLVSGYLVSETFLFQIVPIMVTLAGILYIRRYHGPQQVFKRGTILQQFMPLIPSILPRLLSIVLSAVLYYTGRWYYDTLSIPDGLIRPAENPFYNFTGLHRIRNYIYILAIHIGKSWDIDWVGFSHEYGFDCIRAVDSWADARLLIPVAILAAFAGATWYLAKKQKRRSVLSFGSVLFIVHLSWMTTLFPISGFIKIGTFVSDRIVVASTVSVSILIGNAVTSWILYKPQKHPHTRHRRPSNSSNNSVSSHGNSDDDDASTSSRNEHQKWLRLRKYKMIALGLLAFFMWRRIIVRTLEWMDSVPLLESSLRTCPNFAKGHLEISKIYSGLYPSKFNLTTAKHHLHVAEDIDPDYCDINQQLAHVAIQERDYMEFEDRLTKSLLCPYTMSGSMELWKRYWQMALNEKQNPPDVVKAAQQRYNAYMSLINSAVADEEHKSSSSARTLGGGKPQQQQQRRSATGTTAGQQMKSHRMQSTPTTGAGGAHEEL